MTIARGTRAVIALVALAALIGTVGAAVTMAFDRDATHLSAWNGTMRMTGPGAGMPAAEMHGAMGHMAANGSSAMHGHMHQQDIEGMMRMMMGIARHTPTHQGDTMPRGQP